MSDTQFKKQLKDYVDSNSFIYPLAKSLYRKYCNIAGPFHLSPDFIIFGISRSGTTSLFQYLSKHPNIEPCAIKEPHYFDQYYDRGINWYRMNFPLKWQNLISTKIKNQKLVTGEATGAYLLNPHAPKRIYDLNPKIKLILLLRNPIDRAFSHYQRKLNNGTEKLSFEEAIEKENSRIAGELEKMEQNEKYYSDNFHTNSYLATGLCASRLKRWLEYFPLDQISIIENEDFLQNPQKIYDETLNFLGLPHHKLSNTKKFSKQKSSIQINPKTREKLVEYCKPFNEELFSIIGKRFDWEK